MKLPNNTALKSRPVAPAGAMRRGRGQLERHCEPKPAGRDFSISHARPAPRIRVAEVERTGRVRRFRFGSQPTLA
jgi:hypothetical protein